MRTFRTEVGTPDDALKVAKDAIRGVEGCGGHAFDPLSEWTLRKVHLGRGGQAGMSAKDADLGRRIVH